MNNTLINATAREQANTLEAQFHWLQNEINIAQQNVALLNHQTGVLENELLTQRGQTAYQCEQRAQRERELTFTRKQINALESKNQWLLKELDSAIGKLQTQQAEANIRIDELNRSSHHWWTISQTQQAEANIRIDELNRSSHHWRTVADQAHNELQQIYTSKSWQITCPLRKATQMTKWALALPAHTFRRVPGLTKSGIKLIVIWMMRRILSHHRLASRIRGLLSRFPAIKQHLLLFAIRAELITETMTSTSSAADAIYKVSQNTLGKENMSAYLSEVKK